MLKSKIVLSSDCPPHQESTTSKNACDRGFEWGLIADHSGRRDSRDENCDSQAEGRGPKGVPLP